MPAARQPVICVVDRSPPCRPALEWAAREAWLRGIPVRLCAVAAPPPYGDGRLDPETARDVVDEAADHAARQWPALMVQRVVAVAARPEPALAEISAEAPLVVVGRSRAGVSARSLPVSLAQLVDCPVVVGPTREGGPTEGPVVVGVDETSRGRAALLYAIQEAGLRDAPVVAVHAWSWPDVPSGQAGQLGDLDPARLERDAKALLDRAVVAPVWGGNRISVETRVVRGAAGHALAHAVPSAGLVVIGHRRRRAWGRRLLGSVALDVLRLTTGPVALVRQVGAERVGRRGGSRS